MTPAAASSGAVEIQRLTRDEGERLRAVRLRALQDAPDAFGSTLEEVAARPPESWSEQLSELATFVAALDGADVGLARGGPHDASSDAAMLASMWVVPEARGRGVGEALIGAVVDWARSGGFARLLLDVGDRNAPAIALYARMGFEPTGATSTLPPPRERFREHERVLKL